MLISGDGATRKVEGIVTGIGMRVADESGKMVYYFDSVGRITQIKSGLVGTTIYSFSYDGAGRLLSITQPFGRVTNFTRNSAGDLQSISAPNGAVTNVIINSNGLLEEVSNPNSEEYTMTYHGTSGGLLSTFTKPSGDTTTLVYDSNGNLLSDTHSNGFSLTLNSTGDVVSTITSEGVVRTSTYSNFNKTETLTSPFGFNTLVTKLADSSVVNSPQGGASYFFSPDPRFGAQVNSISNSIISNFGVRSSSFTRSAVLSSPGDPFSITSLTNVENIGTSQNTSIYNGAAKNWTTTSKLGRVNSLTLDTYERIISEQKGTLTAKSYTYTNDLLTKINQGVLRETNLAFYPNKLLQSVTNALGEVTSFTYDNAERLLTKTLPDLRVISYSYDSNGNITSITPPSRPVHTLTYGLNEKLVDYTPPSLSGLSTVNTVYTYDLDKRLTKITRPDGKEVDFSYDPTTGLLDTTSGLFGTITTTHSNGLPSIIQDHFGSSLNMSYIGNTVSSVDLSVTAGAVYSYSRTPNATAGEKTASETISGLGASSVNRTVAYAYNDDELLTGAGTMSLVYNVPNGQLTATTLTNIKDYTYYNSFGEVIQYVVKKGTPVIYQYDLIRDNLGRVTKKTELLNAVTTIWDYLYDSAGRLTQVSKNSAIVATYSYDNNSNRTGGIIRGVSTTAIYDNQDRLATYNGVTRSYNANGELLTLGTAILTYDVFGNLNQYVNGSTNVTYEVDPLQRRLGRTINGVGSSRTRYIYNPENQVIGELNYQNKLTKTFIYATKSHVPNYYIDSGGNKFRIITDHLGSVRMVVNASTGTVSQYMEHDEFGVVLTDTNPGLIPFGFAGGLYTSQSGLVRFGARDYDPQTGRWLSKDPIRFKGGDSNLYGYVMQDPINFIDPKGLYNSSPGEGGNDPGYIDVNLTIGLGPVVTGGVQVGSGATCFYVGGGAGTPGVGVSYQPGAPSYSDSVCGSISNGISVGGSVGSETSPSVGISGPGLSITYQRTLICF